MRLKPDAANLLATALAAYREEILPQVAPEKRYAGLMIANALAMAAREIAAPARRQPPAFAAVYDDIVLTAEAFERRLAADIAAGAFDAPGPRREAAFAAVKAINAERLAITNPKLLKDG